MIGDRFTKMIAGLLLSSLLAGMSAACGGGGIQTTQAVITQTTSSEQASSVKAETTAEVPTSTIVPVSITTTMVSPATAAPETAEPTSITPQDELDLQIALEKMSGNFVVFDGVERIDEYTGSYILVPVVRSNDPAVTAQIEAVLEQKMAAVLEDWDLYPEKKATAIQDKKTFSFVFHVDTRIVNSYEMLTVFCRIRQGKYASEWEQDQYFSVNIDRLDGHVISFEELQQRLKIDTEEIAIRTNSILEDRFSNYAYDLLGPDEVNESTLFYDGISLRILVPLDNQEFIGLRKRLIDLDLAG